MHKHFMNHALNLARRGLGRTSPNPAVGCVIVKNNIVIGQGWTADGGRPHAETIALTQAGNESKGASAYISLEPCAHEGKTPSCAQALVKAGIKRAIIAYEDPDPRTAGQGIQMLKDAGIEVIQGVLENEARALNAGFILRITQNRPFITLKIATSSDHKIAAAQGQRTQISGNLAHRYMHLLRSQHDAILIGANTARIDNPTLTTRIEGYKHITQRFILGNASIEGFTTIKEHNIKDALSFLAEKGITRLLIEGGATIHSAFLESGYCDEFQWLKAPHALGEEGVNALKNHDISDIESDFGLKKHKSKILEEDLLEIHTRKA